MSAFLPKDKIYGSEQANDNRMITVIRWIVEAANRRLKQFKYLDVIVPNSTLPYIFDYISIVAALINAFQPPCIQDTANDQYTAGEMLQRRNKKNVLEEKLNDKEFLKVKKWEKMEDATAAPKFPPMRLAVLNDITLGVFSVKQAISYVNEHIDENGTMKFFILWYLGYARYDIAKVTQRSKNYLQAFIDAQTAPSSDEDSDEDNLTLYSLA
ncbi:unnamed protein product [Didymodactylos carnosus]|uniref:DDE Tnp4 domain-containing protein n=1 Tax=Didymodactylos carnosus TaxID=1234261 RepID=A0A814ES19_9BILA|nr:unnamed protein product [Didymodactylos carnosus]CAF3748863.1 unnamed protein product [Didymodactylos carnosus]